MAAAVLGTLSRKTLRDSHKVCKNPQTPLGRQPHHKGYQASKARLVLVNPCWFWLPGVAGVMRMRVTWARSQSAATSADSPAHEEITGILESHHPALQYPGMNPLGPVDLRALGCSRSHTSSESLGSLSHPTAQLCCPFFSQHQSFYIPPLNEIAVAETGTSLRL